MKKGVRKKIKKNLKNSYVYTLLKICLVVLLLLVVAWVLLLVLEKICEKGYDKNIEDREGLGTLGIFGTDPETSVYFPDDCTDTELKASWNSIFKEGSAGTIIVSNKDTQNNCENYVLYKKLGGSIAYILRGSNQDTSPKILRSLEGYYGNLTSSALGQLDLLDNSNLDSQVTAVFFDNLEDGSEGVKGVREIVSSSDAKLNFSIPYEINSNSWVEESEIYKFTDKGTGNVIKNKTMDYFSHSIWFLKPINLTQTSNVPNFILNESKLYSRILDLNDYFENPGSDDENLSWIYRFSPGGAFSIVANSQFLSNRNLDFDINTLARGNFIVNITLAYPGKSNVTSNNFYVNVSGCYDSDGGIDSGSTGTVQNLTASLTDYCTGNYSIKEYFCSGQNIIWNNLNCNGSDFCYQGRCVVNGSINRAPRSHGLQKCVNPKWNKDKNYTINGNECFFDEDDDILTFRYGEINLTSNENLTYSDNLTFSWEGNNLTLAADKNWTGQGSFKFFASDSKNETRITVNFKVFNISDEEGELVEIFEIISPNPSDVEVFMVIGEQKNFSIGNTDYEGIKWYVDSTLIRTGSRQFRVGDLGLGNHTIIVEIKKGDSMDSRSWKVYVSKEEPFIEKISKIGDLMFYFIIFVVLIVIFLVIWVFLSEKNRQKQKNRFGFGVSNVKISANARNI